MSADPERLAFNMVGNLCGLTNEQREQQDRGLIAMKMLSDDEREAILQIGRKALIRLEGRQFDIDDPTHSQKVFGDSTDEEREAFVKWIRLSAGIIEAGKDG